MFNRPEYTLEAIDPELLKAINQENRRQEDHIALSG
jgi:glycine hydroxymethyltransferase